MCAAADRGVPGSIRIPSLCCGTYGFKPTANRIPYGGQKGCNNPGLKFVLASAGPISNDIGSLEAFMKLVLGTQPASLDSTAIDVPWRDARELSGRKLRLGILPEDPVYPLHPPVRNAVSEAVAKLRAAGHILVDLTAEECRVAGLNEVLWGFFSLDDKASRMVTDAGEPRIPSRDRIASEWERLTPAYVPDLTEFSFMEKLAILNVKIAEATEGWRKLWQSHGLDAVLGPAAQNTAVKHDDYGIPPYTGFLNLLNVCHRCYL